MEINDRYKILFEPVQIGPVTAPNRFFQVPHCNGMGYMMPRGLAEMRRMKAEGGWGVVCTEEVEIHHSSDLSPSFEGRIWADEDVPGLVKMTEAVHAHGSLAGIELTYAGRHGVNRFSRSTSYSLRSMSFDGYSPGQTRMADKEDIRNIRKWHRNAAIRAKKAGFDIVYCYAGHDLSLPMHFLLKRYNNRTDEYGGSLENRVRFLRELIEDTKDAIGDTCGVALRLAVDELMGEDGLTYQGEGHDIVAMLAELPDLWDVNVSSWKNDSATSRFKKEGYQEQYIGFVKSMTTKPVVAVGRYTSPDSMVSVIKRGVMDLIGSARPSISDPFLPEKIKEDRLEDIRECIGCNICASADNIGVPIRCTQNPTMGEEWRRGWHPEKISAKHQDDAVMVVGGGPAGLECGRALGQRGYEVVLLDARREFGGRVELESQLPGLTEWRRVAEWRLAQIEKLPNVSLYPESEMAAEDVLEAGMGNVVIATGATWRKDGVGRTLLQPVPGVGQGNVYSPDDLMAGKTLDGKVVVYDDDHYYMGSVLAEHLVKMGCKVTLVTPAPLVSCWTDYTLEQDIIQDRLVKLGVRLVVQGALNEVGRDHLAVTQANSGVREDIPMDALVMVTERIPNDALYYSLKPALKNGGLKTLRVIGDAEAPHIIAQAVFSGHLAAREFGQQIDSGAVPFRRELTIL